MSKIASIMVEEMQCPWKYGQTFHPYSMAVTRRLILYMRTYISTRTKLVPWIDQVYQQISLRNPFNFNSQPKYPIFFARKFSPYSPYQHPSINRLKVFPRKMVEEKYLFPFFFGSLIWPLGSCLPNSSSFWAINKLTKFKDKIKILWRLCSPCQWPPTNKIVVFFCPVSPEIMSPQLAIWGWRLNLSRFGYVVPGST